MSNWEEEFERCKRDEAYFFENYCLINEEKPGKYTVEKFKKYVLRTKIERKQLANKARRPNSSIQGYLTRIREYPITPEDAFPQSIFLEDG